MNKRQFDLGVAIFVGCYAAMTGFRLWATKELAVGNPQGPMFKLAEVTKAVTG